MIEDRLRQAREETKSLPGWMRRHVELAKAAYARQCREDIPRSSNGRTAASEAVNVGSTPTRGSKQEKS